MCWPSALKLSLGKDVCQYFPQCAKCQPHQQWEWGPESVLQGARQLEAGGLFLFDNRNGDPLTVMFWHGEYLSLCLCWWRDNVRNVPPPLLHVCTLKRRHSSPSPARATTLEMEIGLSSLYICVPHLFFIMQSKAEHYTGMWRRFKLLPTDKEEKKICFRCHACPLIFAKLQNN